jgi:hypothetical protein
MYLPLGLHLLSEAQLPEAVGTPAKYLGEITLLTIATKGGARHSNPESDTFPFLTHIGAWVARQA